MKEGDVIRFGRIPFKIARMKLDENAPLNDNSLFNMSGINDVSNPDVTNININAADVPDLNEPLDLNRAVSPMDHTQ